MAARIRQWMDKIDALTLRERVILLIAGLVVVGFIWMQVFYSPAENQIRITQQNIDRVVEDVDAFHSQVVGLEARLKRDPNVQLQKDIGQLITRVEMQKIELEKRLAGLVAPSEMVDVLREVLSRFKNLNLVSVENAPVTVFYDGARASSGEQAELDAELDEKDKLIVYAHSVDLVFEGKYFNTVAFLDQLEAMNKAFHWRLLEYKVTRYPRAKVTLTLRTLSLNKEWIGV